MAGKDASASGTFGALLRICRLASNLTQAELAERSGLSIEAIGALERGRRRSPRPSTVEWLAEALKLDALQKDALVVAARGRSAAEALPDRVFESAAHAAVGHADAQALLDSLPTDILPPHAPLPAGSRMPLCPNPLFVGRGEEILQVAAALRGGDSTVVLGQVVASTGLGGLGKTQLAVELVHRYARFFAGGVYWLSFASADEIPLQVAACAGPGAMDLTPRIENLPVEERVQRVQRAWQSPLPRLLVFDNCEEETLLELWRPPSGGCRVLVTSRRSHWTPTLGVTNVPLDLLPRSDSIELLCRYRPDLAPNEPGLDVIAHELGDLPLAVHLAGSYLRAYRSEISLDGYLAGLQRSNVVRHASLLGAALGDSPSPTHHVQGVAQTFALCLSRLDRDREVDQVAIALLAGMACMAPGEPVPRDLLAATLEEMDPLGRADGLRRLGAVGLLEEGDGWLKLHRLLVHFVREEGLDQQAQPAVDRALIECGKNAGKGHLTGPALTAVIPHLVDAASRDVRDEPRLAELCNAAGLALRSLGDLHAARPWLEHALEIRERVRGPNHADTAESLSELAHLLRDHGELATARSLYERALSIRELVLGSDHPDTAEGIDNLASLLQDLGELAVARPLYERGLEIREHVLGPGHPETATSLNNVATLLHTSGKLVEARPLYEQALAIRQRVLGPDHPDTARSLNNLALLLQDQGEMAAARPLYERALAIKERVLGRDHPNTISSLNNLALLLRDQNELAEARRLYERALTIAERVLGPDHPHTATPLNNLGDLLREQGELAAAGPLLERALAIRERILGSDHSHTALSLNNLARLLQAKGELAAARPLFQRALAIRERVLGSEHRDTVATRRALAELTSTRPPRRRR